MELNWLESIIYAFVSGIAEFLPVSSKAHQAVLLNLFGNTASTVVLDFCIHLACLIAVYIHCQSTVAAINRTSKLLTIPARRRKRQPDRNLTAELQFLRIAALPALLMILLAGVVNTAAPKLNILALCLLANGIVLYITGHIPVGNKKSLSMNRLESLLMGIASSLGILPGVSRMGMGLSAGIMCGTSAENALRLGLLLSIPVLGGLCVADIVFMFTVGTGIIGFLAILQCIISGAFAYLGAFLAMRLMRFAAVKVGFSWFSYYCWGLALFAFLLFMI